MLSDARKSLVACPDWLLMAVFSMPVLFWLYKRKWGLRRYRRRHNLCEKCAYSLQGLPVPVRCPECGTIAAWKQAAAKPSAGGV